MSSSSERSASSGGANRPPPPKRRAWLWLVLFVVVALAYVRVAMVEGVAPPPAPREGLPSPLQSVVFVLALFGAPLLIGPPLARVVMFVLARLLGLEDTNVRLGALRLRLDGGALSMGWRRAPAGAPLLASVVVPPVERPWRWWVVTVCGTLTVPLVTLLVSVWVLSAMGSVGASVEGPLRTVAFTLPLYFTVIMALPLLPLPLPVSRVGPGAVWRAIRDGGPAAAQERGIEQLLSASMDGRRPKDWPPEAILALTDAESPRRSFAALFRLQWALDTQRWDEALALAQAPPRHQDVQVLADPGSRPLIVAWLKASYGGPLALSAARTWFAEAGDLPAAPGLRELASAAIALAEGHTDQAAERVRSGRDAVRAAPSGAPWLNDALDELERVVRG